MRSNNPVLGRAFNNPTATYQAPAPSAHELEQMYQSPPAVRTGAMTYDDVVAKTGFMFVALVAGAIVGWRVPDLAFVGMIGGFALAMVNIFKKEPSPPLMIAYAVLQGLFVGGISVIIGRAVDNTNIVSQAVIGTLGVAGVSLWLYKSGRVRVTPKFQRTLMVAMGGYLVFVLINFGYMLFSDSNALFGFRSGPLGIVIGLFAIGLAAFILMLDFDFIDKGVQGGIPAKYAWTAAFGLTVTMVWLYIEILRLLAIFQGE